MPRALAILSLTLVAVSVPALAQSTRKIPVERDLERYQRLEERLELNGTGSLAPYYPPADRYYVPSGRVAAPNVPGFDGPPGGILRDSVGNSGPLPPGSPVNIGNE